MGLPEFPSTADVFAQVTGQDFLRNGEASVLFWSHGLGNHRVQAVFVNLGEGGVQDWHVTYALDPEDGDRYLNILVAGHPVDVKRISSSRVRQIIRERISDDQHQAVLAVGLNLMNAAFGLAMDVCRASGEAEYRNLMETAASDNPLLAALGVVSHADAPEFSCGPTVGELARDEEIVALCHEFASGAKNFCDFVADSVPGQEILPITKPWPLQRDISGLN